MKDCIITITNSFGFNKSIIVDNFSDNNVKNALGKVYSIDVDNLQCLSTGGDKMVYGVKELTPSLEKRLTSTANQYLDTNYAHIILITTSVLEK